MPSSLRAAALAVVVLLASVAHADPRDDARREFAAGQAADKQRDWQTAIDHYQRANELVPHPNTMFNIATNYERLGKLRDAAAWFAKYLDAAPESPDRTRVAKQLASLKQRPGTITVRSTPSGATVSIDGTQRGLTTYAGHLAAGEHTVTVTLGNAREERKVLVEFGEPQQLDVKLRAEARQVVDPPAAAANGTLRVTGLPGAQVEIDGEPVGVVPLELAIRVGQHRVRVTHEGYQPFETTVGIAARRDTRVDARQSRTLGTFGEATKPNTLQVGYLIGFSGGADTGGDGALLLAEFGARTARGDVSVRVGKTTGLTAIDLLLRWTVTDNRLAPFLTAGYSFVAQNTGGMTTTSGGAYFLGAGLRLDVSRGERTTIAIGVEGGIRYFFGINSADATTTGSNGLIVPVMASLQLHYRK